MWFRRDLRLDDLPALAAAGAAGGDGVVPLFVVDPRVLRPTGPNRRRFLARCLRELDRQLDGRLVLRVGDPSRVVPAVAAETGASVVTATADFGPYGRRRDRAVANALAADGRLFSPVSSPYLVPPGMVRAQSGAPLRVFGPFRRAWEAVGWDAPAPAPAVRFVPAPSTTSLEDIEHGLAAPGTAGLPRWWEGLPLGGALELPTAGPSAALARLERFAQGALETYAQGRENPGEDGTSKLSPYLHFGCVHPRTVIERLGAGPGAERLRSELAWRDFYADVLWHQPGSVHQPLQDFGRHLRWDDDGRARERFRAWATGRTGYPLVDAGMRQLLAEGWLHNRARMVVASFLVKDLHIDWRLGARWFLWHLVDGDLASNQHGWQWVAGTGTDAAPFHRIFNPETQRERFDPGDKYVRRFLGASPGPGAPSLLSANGPSAPYPAPIVDHARERRDALARFEVARRVASGLGVNR
jgi:deoxyribodipyrimidine photo-lyase